MPETKTALDDLRIRRPQPVDRPLTPWIVLGIILIAFLAIGAIWMRGHPRAIEVQTFTVREAASNSGKKTLLNASGYVTPRREATVSSKVTGKVAEVFVEEGLKVKEGQILARLDDSNVAASLRLAETQLDAAKAGLAETQVRLREAERELRRVSGLAENKIATQADLDHAEAEFSSNEARLARQRVDVLVAERQVAVWRQQMEDNIIRAPFSGVVTAKNAQPGEMISPISAGGGFTRTGIGTIVDMDSLEIEVDVNESFINRVEPGQQVQATLDAYPDWRIPCKVIAIIPTADRQKATVKVRVGFDRLDARILPQMGVKVAFQESKEVSVGHPGLLIPKQAVLQDSGRSIAFLVQNERVERRAVTLGETTGDEVAVLAGLVPGEVIITDNLARLKPGDAVRQATRQ